MNPSWRDWNEAICRATFSEEYAGRVVYLAIDKEEIGRIGWEFGLDPNPAYDSFRSAVIAEVRHGWPNPHLPIAAGGFPGYVYALAAQVLAAFQMHDDGLTSDDAYWRRLREFLRQSSEDKMPEGLKGDQHTALWYGFKRWANKTNGGRFGRVQLVEKRTGHRFVAEPLGQCLLRRADLDRLRDLFSEFGRPDPEPYGGRRLRELVADALVSQRGRYFFEHGRRVLESEERADAWEQVEAEYLRFLAEEGVAGSSRRIPETLKRTGTSGCGDSGSVTTEQRSKERRARVRTTVRLQIVRGKLSGGLYKQENGQGTCVISDISEVLRRFYLREGRDGSLPNHKPPHDTFLLATLDDGFGAFVEKSTCHAGEDVLLLVPDPSFQAWLDEADPCLFVDAPRRYRPLLGSDCPGWAPLVGLPLGWIALRFKTREDLSKVTLDGKWGMVVDRRATGLRAVGGLTLGRGVWMLGAGPTVRLVGPGSFDHVLVDGELYPLDASQSATPDLRAGEHRIGLPGSRVGALRFRIQEPRFDVPPDLAGWHRVEGGWPTPVGERCRIDAVPYAGTLYGPRLVGDWPSHHVLEPQPHESPSMVIDILDEMSAMILAMSHRRGRRSCPLEFNSLIVARTAAARSANPLLRGMFHANHFAMPFAMDKA